MERVRHIDPDAARHRDTVVRAQLTSCRRLAARLDEEGRLAPPWTIRTATDMLWALISTDMIDGLINDRRWSRKRLAESLATVLRSTFTTDATRR